MKTQDKKFSPGRVLLIIITSILLVPSCDERWEEMNTNPNSLTDIPDEYLFTSSIRQLFRDPIGGVNIDFAGQYSHVFVSDNWHREIDKYNSFNSQSDFPEQVFQTLYQGAIRTSTETMELTKPGGLYENSIRYEQASVINVVAFSIISDLYGDIPYYEGGRAKYGFLKPEYDTQEDIYKDLIDRLGNSVNTLKTGDIALAYPSGIDPIFDGDIGAWVRFANSIRLRLAVRARHVDPTTYNPIISDIIAEDLIENNSQNVKLTNWDSDNGELYNPWHNKRIDLNGGLYSFLLGEFFIELLKANNDPRLPFYATDNQFGEYVGMPNGLVDSHSSLPSYGTWDKTNTSQPSEEFFAKDQPLYLITASEVWLLRAELALFTLGAGDANTMYQTGIQMAMEQWDIDATETSNFISLEPEATLYGTLDNQFRQIATQLYIAAVPNTLESWSTIRRTNYPVIPQRTADNFSKGATDGFLPSRLNYPSTIEVSVNGDNLQAAIDRLGGEDKIDIKLWWDIN